MLSHKTPTNLNSWGFLQENNSHVNWAVWGPACTYSSEGSTKQSLAMGTMLYLEH